MRCLFVMNPILHSTIMRKSNHFRILTFRRKQRFDVVTDVGAGTSRTRDQQFTWRHNTYSHCRLRLFQHITGGSSQHSAVALFNLYVAASEGSGVGKGGGPPLAALLWGRHYGLWCCRPQTCKGCIEIKVVLMSGHYSQLKDASDFE